MKRTIVISAVNIRKGGTLTILRECLAYLSGLTDEWNVVALVHDRSLCDYAGIEYIELPGTVRSWGRRLWCEYVTMQGISKALAARYGSKVHLWLSLHDTSPRVEAEHQAVYCQTSFPFLKWKLRDLRMDPKIPLFALFTEYAYKINVRADEWLIVQAEWLKKGLSRMLKVSPDKFIVAPVKTGGKAVPAGAAVGCPGGDAAAGAAGEDPFTFLYPASGDCHKNFETLCEAARLLSAEVGPGKFRVLLTIGGGENRYTRWLKSRWGSVDSICWNGLMTREQLFACYGSSDCLVFPSRVETWGLPISEFLPTGKPVIVSDLPFAHETTAGASHVAFFDPASPSALKEEMLRIMNGDLSHTVPVERRNISGAAARSWEEIFSLLLG